MTMTTATTILLCLATAARAVLAVSDGGYAPAYNASVRPLVIWHGMGDSANSSGMADFAERIREMHPGIFVHSVRLADDEKDDQRAGFFGHVNEQVAYAAAQLANLTELRHGYDAIGFSQGGQFLRALAQRHPSPPMHNLLTFGAQHMGVSDVPRCNPRDVSCALMHRAARAGVYTAWAQRSLVQAQYFREPARMALYLARNAFLPDVNGELAAARNASYAANLASLSNLVLVMFGKDVTVVPKESAWFGSEMPPPAVALPADHAQAQLSLAPPPPPVIIPMRAQPLYTEDWIGLRALDEAGKVHLETCDEPHMHLPEECWEDLVRTYVGGALDK